MPALDFSNPLLWIVIVSAILHLVHLAITSALFLGFVIVLTKKVKADVHEWASALSKWLTGLGFTSNITNPLDKVAAGDFAGALGAGATLITYCANPNNAAIEWANVIPTLLKDPATKKMVTDALAGAPAATLQADLVPLITNARAAVPQPAGVTQAHDLIAHLPTLLNNSTLLEGAKTLLANGQGDAIAALLAGHAVGAAKAGAVAGATAGATAGPVPAAVGAALGTAAGVAVSGLLDGHTVTVSAQPGSPAASVLPAPTAPVTQAA